MAFLAEGATTLSAGALTRRAAAIAAKHRHSGLASPTADPTVTAILREARGSATPRRAPRKTPATLTRMAARCPRDLARDARSRVAAAGRQWPRSCRAGRPRCRAYPLYQDGGGTFLRSGQPSGPSRRGRGQGGCSDCQPQSRPIYLPVQALRDWLDTSHSLYGPVFRKIDRWGTLEHHRLGIDAIRRILARRSLRRPMTTRPVIGRPRKGRAG